ncbi:unnamed protein product [Diatraea saccharalis]|uniref:C2H2-type domain-containing protein n=1 Tax=Diatraea saccharalis TaxID=40085 RepID=A0A9N9QY58_9NEOP|nr:unnamed protein product [Diatraea saccharalis]
MLVNHMWRVHDARAAVPLERRVRHYPCVACPKLYRAASKRDEHVRRHHPGVELVKGSSIDTGTRSCEPAACPLCPRQYVTRAKMLQHMRAAHPDRAPPKQSRLNNDLITG